MKITRINSLDDSRFSHKILKQHGAFLVDDKYICEFEIINENSAIIRYEYKNIDEIIDLFRFYAEHIIRFYDQNMNLYKEFPEVEDFWIDIESIQPSQFYVSEEKVKALDEFIKTEEDIIIPFALINNDYVSLDGHSRLCIGIQRGFKKVKGFFTEYDNSIKVFVEEAKKRNIKTPYDIKKLNHEEFELKWIGYCNKVFENI